MCLPNQGHFELLLESRFFLNLDCLRLPFTGFFLTPFFPFIFGVRLIASPRIVGFLSRLRFGVGFLKRL